MFDGKICVVTGGARGIGRSIVEEFARRGGTVAFIDTDKAAGGKLAEDIKLRFGVDAFFFHGSVCSEEDLEIFAGAVIGQYGGVDYLVNNARVRRSAVLSGRGYDAFDTAMKVSVTAPYLLTKLFRNSFYKGGAVVNISGAETLLTHEDAERCSAAEGAVVSLTHALAASLKGEARVNCVSPGVGGAGNAEGTVREKKAKQLLKRVGEPFDVTRTVLFLCEEKADFINGQNITVDGGMTKMMVYHNQDGWTFTK